MIPPQDHIESVRSRRLVKLLTATLCLALCSFVRATSGVHRFTQVIYSAHDHGRSRHWPGQGEAVPRIAES